MLLIGGSLIPFLSKYLLQRMPFTGDKYIGGVKNLGERFDIKSLKLVDATKAFTETPTRS